jgi:cbb3-type cytochrome c oxidase subunit III
MKVLLVIALGMGAAAAGAQPGAEAAPGRGVPALVAQDTVGKAIFMGKGLCTACHGPDAKGTALAPNLTDEEWLHADGTVATIAKVVKEGVAQPKKHPAPMPPMGGAQLTDAEIQAVAQYVASLSAKPAG